jgi:mono/diheme cytochrome c family protein
MAWLYAAVAPWHAGAMPIRIAVALTILAVTSALAAAQGFLPWNDRAVTRQGAAIYAEHCAACHGAKLEGEADWRTPKPNGRMPAPPHDATGHTWHHADALLFALTARGVADVVGRGYESDMPGFAGVLTDAEIIAVLAYIKSTWPAHIRRRHDEINRRSSP